MDPSDIAFIKGVVTFVVLAATGLTAARIWLRARPRTLPQMDEVMKSLREENARTQEALESRIADLEERLHFTERLLANERAPARLNAPDERPPA